MRVFKEWETSIDDRKITITERGKRLQWEICLPDGSLEVHETKGKNCTDGQIRARARATAAKIKANYYATGDGWLRTDLAADYIKKVCIPAVKDAPEEGDEKVSSNSKVLYVRHLGYLAKELGTTTIERIYDINLIERALNAIAEAHGTSTAKQVRKVANKWFFDKLFRDKLIDHNLLNETIARVSVVNMAVKKPTGGIALTDDEYNRALDYMMNANPNDPLRTARHPGAWSQKDNAAKRLLVIELSLMQATSGLRISEGRYLLPSDCRFTDDVLYITVRPEVSKTDRGRTVAILDAEVASRLLKRIRKAKRAKTTVFPHPTDPTKIWDKSDCEKAVNRFLRDEVGPACGIPALCWPTDDNGKRIDTATLEQMQIPQASHVWRTTLNTKALREGMPEEMRAAFFGHTVAVNKRSYTDTTDTSMLINALMRK